MVAVLSSGYAKSIVAIKEKKLFSLCEIEDKHEKV